MPNQPKTDKDYADFAASITATPSPPRFVPDTAPTVGTRWVEPAASHPHVAEVVDPAKSLHVGILHEAERRPVVDFERPKSVYRGPDVSHYVKAQVLSHDHPQNLPDVDHVEGVIHVTPLERPPEVDPRRHRAVTIQLSGATMKL